MSRLSIVRALALAIAALAFWSSGCSKVLGLREDLPGGECVLRSDCAPDKACVFAVCSPLCQADKDCPPSNRCLKTVSDGNRCVDSATAAAHDASIPMGDASSEADGRLADVALSEAQPPADGASETEGSDAGDQGAIGTANMHCSPDNAYACAGHAQKTVLSCNPTTHVWTALQPCAGQQLCDATPGPNQGSCQDPAAGCAGKMPGDKVCSGTQSVTCGPDLVTSTSEACPKLCIGNGQCVACTPMSKQCSGNGVETCQMDGTWGAAVACPKACVGNGECGACAPMDKQCSNNGVETCQTDGTYGAAVTCVNKACVSGACIGVCSPAAVGCSGLQQQTCDVNGVWQNTGAACVNQACVNGGCTGVCSPNPTPTYCANNTPQFCDANGARQNSGVACVNQACVTGACTGVCIPTAVRCSGSQPQTCDANGAWQNNGAACAGATPWCVAGGACKSAGPSCAGLAATCGPGGNESCCAANVVTGGTYNRSNDVNYPATLSDFRLDNYEITVGRFRKFVAVYSQTMTAAGSGKNPNNASDPGWDVAYNASLPASAAALTTAVQCYAGYDTWSGGNDSRPMNCIDWYEAYAFCIWDGGRLPTEAEWNYATAGGSEQRQYPWGATAPGANANLAVYGCYYNGTGPCTGFNNIAPVGSVSAGDGKWGQSDLTGNVWEWTEDGYASPYTNPCNNCSTAAPAYSRVIRGGSFFSNASNLLSSNRNTFTPSTRLYYNGARCSRTR